MNRSVLLFPALNFIGTKVSNEYVHVDPSESNSVDVEVWPDGTGSATFTVIDSGIPATGFYPTVDNAYVPTLTNVASYTKVRVSSVMEYVRLQVTITSGTWYARVTPIRGLGGPVTVINTATQNLTQVGGVAIALGQATMAGSLPVALASDQPALPVSGTFWQATQPVSATSLPLPTGAATLAKQPALGTAGTASADVLSVQGVAAMTPLKTDGSGVTQPTKEVRAGTPAQSSVNVLLVSLSILAANANRLGATIYNEGPSACLTKLGATASATSYSISIASGGYYELPFGFTGAIDGICAANNAQLRVTEVSV